MKIYISCGTSKFDPFWIEENANDYKSNRVFTYAVYEDRNLTGKGKIVYESYKLQDCANYIVRTCKRYIDMIDSDSQEYVLYSSMIDTYSSDDIPINRSSNIDDFESAESSTVVQIGVKRVLEVVNIDVNPGMFVFDDDYTDSMRANGVYRGLISKSGTIVLNSSATYRTVIHEIGHYVHHRYFGDRRFSFSSDDGRSKYSHKNYKEAFAEVFTEFILNPDSDMASVHYMRRILRDRNLFT